MSENQYPAQAAPQYPQNTPQQPPSISGLAVAGLVLGIVGLATSPIPVINLGSLFLGVIGLVLSIIGLTGINKGKNKGKGIAVAGIVLCAITIVVMLLIQAACSSALGSSSSSSAAASASASAAASAATSGQAASSASAEASAPTASSDNGTYAVSIDDATVASDYKGNPALIVTYSWTNKSDKACSFASALYPKCFQNGVQLDAAIVTDDIEAEAYMADVKPGSGTTVQLAYSLKDKSPVEVEVGQLINLRNEVIAARTFEIS